MNPPEETKSSSDIDNKPLHLLSHRSKGFDNCTKSPQTYRGFGLGTEFGYSIYGPEKLENSPNTDVANTPTTPPK